MVKIIAETGAAHHKSYARCLALINYASKAGADAIKFNVFRPDEMTLDSDEPPFKIESGPWSGRKLYDLYEQSALKYDWIPDLRRAAITVGLEFILAVYHPNTVGMLPGWGVRTVKVSSFELGYTDLLKAIAGCEYVRHVILSTGAATDTEIKTALDILGGKDVTLLYCVSAYPVKPSDMNLDTLSDMTTRFMVNIGLSDHSQGIMAPVMAVAMGAVVIEKHLKLDDENLDAGFAVFPNEFKAMADACREAEIMLGEVSYDRPKTYHRKDVDGRMLRVVW